jgi:putative Ca2+/H+ antiporter (TMEM165/GDT1 family)
MSFLAIFFAVFLAELGDKTQIAAATFSANEPGRAMMVFTASSLALVASAAIAVFLGQIAGDQLQRLPLKLISGGIFITLGALMIFDWLRGGA